MIYSQIVTWTAFAILAMFHSLDKSIFSTSLTRVMNHCSAEVRQQQTRPCRYDLLIDVVILNLDDDDDGGGDL